MHCTTYDNGDGTLGTPCGKQILGRKSLFDVTQCNAVKAVTVCSVSIQYRQRFSNVSLCALCQHGLHCLKNNLIVEFLHASNVVRTAVAPMDNRRSVVTKQAGDIAEQAKGRRVRWQS